jgi:hypothetical protein
MEEGAGFDEGDEAGERGRIDSEMLVVSGMVIGSEMVIGTASS